MDKISSLSPGCFQPAQKQRGSLLHQALSLILCALDDPEVLKDMHWNRHVKIPYVLNTLELASLQKDTRNGRRVLWIYWFHKNLVTLETSPATWTYTQRGGESRGEDLRPYPAWLPRVREHSLCIAGPFFLLWYVLVKNCANGAQSRNCVCVGSIGF